MIYYNTRIKARMVVVWPSGGVVDRIQIMAGVGPLGAYETPWLEDVIAQSARKLASFLSKTGSVDARGSPRSLPSGLAGESRVLGVS